MNKTTLKSFATKARAELLEKVEIQARKIGITANKITKATLESSDALYIDGRQLTDEEIKQRNKLIIRIDEIGFSRVIEETAYTWFNRFVALRFMEVNDYLPTKVRVLSSENPENSHPDMVAEALSLPLKIDKEYVYNLKMANETEELFKYLIKLHCNDLNRYMPFMFETIEDYMLILFPDGLLSSESFLRDMINTEIIPEQYWYEIEIIGWLYQFYIAEEKERVFKARKRYGAEEIPFATQLFTPDWIVRYLVQNSLGRYWLEAHEQDNSLRDNWEFYIEHNAEVQNQFNSLRNTNLKVEEIKCFDPAMGSGHILVYLFDVLYEIYRKQGYIEREIPKLIIENNLFGLDIDDRAYQLACFSVVMKALSYNRRFLRVIERDGLKLNLASIQETNNLTGEHLKFIAGEEDGEQFEQVKQFIEQFKDAKSIGSLIKLRNLKLQFIQERFTQLLMVENADLFAIETRDAVLPILKKLIKQTEIMRNKYDILIMNPPYMGSRGMNAALSQYVNTHYPNSKADLFATFMEVDHYLKDNGFYAAINQHSWMFLASYEKLREKLFKTKFIDTMLHLGPRAFEEIGGEVVQSTAFVMRNSTVKNGVGTYLRLVDERSATEKKAKAIEAARDQNAPYRYTAKQADFKKVPRQPVAYWFGENMLASFEKGTPLNSIATIYEGIKTRDNKRFLRFWFEVSNNKWQPYAKGGRFRRWYGNNEYVINWENNGKAIKDFKKSSGANFEHYFVPTLTYSALSSNKFSARYIDESLFGGGGGGITNVANILYIQGLVNSVVYENMFTVISPTLNFEVGQIGSLPVILQKDKIDQVEKIVKENINISKIDWDSYETSWDFTSHPFIKFKGDSIEQSFNNWSQFADEQFYKLKENEQNLNEIFIDIYGLQDELTPHVAEEDVTVNKAELTRDVKSFLSYAVGCMFGRYSLDKTGLINTGGNFTEGVYETFKPDEDNIVPILAEAYFEDDIVTKFVQFVEAVYGKETLEENLNFIAMALGQRRNETDQETIRRYFLTDFYKEHVRTYKKCPIYWQFSSGKERAFNCLIYMHRYDKTTLSRIRTDYLHKVQTRYEVERDDLLAITNSEGSAKEIRDAKRDLTVVERKIAELKKYDEKLRNLADMQIEIDHDNGVAVNYSKFKGLVSRL